MYHPWDVIVKLVDDGAGLDARSHPFPDHAKDYDVGCCREIFQG